MARVPTTAGEIDVNDLGPVLMHEHVFTRTETLQQGWPGLRERGVTDSQMEQMLVRNPREFFARSDGPPAAVGLP